MVGLSLKERIESIDWWHRIDLGNGIVTPGKIDPRETLQRIGMPDDLSGRTVLDIGASDGFYSFEAERRGAERVVATGLWGKLGYRSKEGFDLARAVLDSKVESVGLDLFDMTPEKFGGFDFVLLLGVLYHLRHPLLGLEKVFALTSQQLVLETHVELENQVHPVMRFFPSDELNRDPSNWWGPNSAAVEEMLKDVGFLQVTRVSGPDRQPPPASRLKMMASLITGSTITESAIQGRAAFHAWR